MVGQGLSWTPTWIAAPLNRSLWAWLVVKSSPMLNDAGPWSLTMNIHVADMPPGLPDHNSESLLTGARRLRSTPANQLQSPDLVLQHGSETSASRQPPWTDTLVSLRADVRERARMTERPLPRGGVCTTTALTRLVCVLGSDAGNLGGRFLAPILALRCGGFPAAILELRRGGSTSACRWRRRRR